MLGRQWGLLSQSQISLKKKWDVFSSVIESGFRMWSLPCACPGPLDNRFALPKPQFLTHKAGVVGWGGSLSSSAGLLCDKLTKHFCSLGSSASAWPVSTPLGRSWCGESASADRQTSSPMDRRHGVWVL